MAKILFVGNSPGVVGGQNRVAYFTIKELLALGHQVWACGQGSQVLPEGEQSPCPLFPFDSSKAETVIAAINQCDPDVVLCSHDLWLFYMITELKQKKPKPKYIGWFTIDAHPLHSSWYQLLRSFDYVCASTFFGKSVIYASYPEKAVDVVQYGIQQDIFKPAANKLALKKQFGEVNKLPGFENKCLFIFAGANQYKKSIGTSVDAFNLLGNPHAHMLLALKQVRSQVGPYAYDGEYDLHDLIRNKNISVMLAHLSDESLAGLYQMADFLVYPSQGEAPGLQIGEAQLCGCMPIVSNYTEMPLECAISNFVVDDLILYRGQFNCYRAIVNPAGLSAKMADAFNWWYNIYVKGDTPALQGYIDFRKKAADLFKNRTWANTGKGLNEVINAALYGDTRLEATLADVG